MNQKNFPLLAEKALNRLFQQAEAGLKADIDLKDGVLTIILDSGATYLLNRHLPNQQIWLSSPQSGASHYAFDEASQDWISTRADKISLVDRLNAELTPSPPFSKV
ncbi:MAG: iron donor protein CyaY [Dongiaceae bacterium]